MKNALLAMVILVSITTSAFAKEVEIIVSAAASLTDVLSVLKTEAEQYIGAKIIYNFGGSGTLRKQIEEGAPADLFFSASSEDMDKLEKAGHVLSGVRKDLLSNTVVLIGEKTGAMVGSTVDLKAILSSASLLAIGNPDSVPAGRYAVLALKSLDLYAIVEKKLVLAGSVREVLQYVQSGSAPFGIVFLTDALSVKPTSLIVTLYHFPENTLTTPVLYPAAVVAASKHKDIASKLLVFFQGLRARDVFAKAGFIVK
jgi:molybdenum ABC transporter, periplasmic molybdate-binding protein